MTTQIRFPLGAVVITANAGLRLSTEEVLSALHRHASGDWGNLCPEDTLANHDAMYQGGRLLSAYHPRGFHRKNVHRLVSRYLGGGPLSPRQALKRLLRPHEWLASELVEELKVSRTTLHDWMKAGWLEYRRIPDQARRVYACWADAAELKRLHELARRPRHWYDPPLPTWLTTPHAKPPKRQEPGRGKGGTSPEK